MLIGLGRNMSLFHNESPVSSVMAEMMKMQMLLMITEWCDHKDGKKKVNYTSPREFKKGKELKALCECLLIQNIFKEKVILQQINYKFCQWKAAFFFKSVSPSTPVTQPAMVERF